MKSESERVVRRMLLRVYWLSDAEVCAVVCAVVCAAVAVTKTHGRLVQSFSLQLPVSVDVLLRDLSLELGRFRLRHLHAVQWSHHLDVTLCRGSSSWMKENTTLCVCVCVRNLLLYADDTKKRKAAISLQM